MRVCERQENRSWVAIVPQVFWVSSADGPARRILWKEDWGHHRETHSLERGLGPPLCTRELRMVKKLITKISPLCIQLSKSTAPILWGSQRPTLIELTRISSTTLGSHRLIFSRQNACSLPSFPWERAGNLLFLFADPVCIKRWRNHCYNGRTCVVIRGKRECWEGPGIPRRSRKRWRKSMSWSKFTRCFTLRQRIAAPVSSLNMWTHG